VIGDSQASLLAHRCFAPGAGKATLGSGSSVLLNIGPAYRDGGEGVVTTIAWTHNAAATYCFEGIINYAAATIDWLKNQLGLIRSAAETETAATAVPDNGGVYLVPAFAGLSAPYWAPAARAAIVGMTSHADRNHIIRAALESIAYQLHDVLEMMRLRAAVASGDLHADGGATANQFLMQFIADITARRIVAATISDGSPLGAAMAGMVGIGVYASLADLAAIHQDVTVHQPQMPPDQSAALHAGWQRAVRQVLAGVP
jgi:glycerol kinase